MASPVQRHPQVAETAAAAGVHVRRTPQGVGADPGSVQPAEERTFGLIERGVRWFCFLWVRVFRYFFPAPQPVEPPAPAPAPERENRFEGTTVHPHSLLQYFRSLETSGQHPVDDEDIYCAFDRLIEEWEKKGIYRKLGRGFPMSFWEKMRCRDEDARMERDVRVGKEVAKKTPSLLIPYIRPFLEKYCEEHPQSSSQ